MQTNPQWQKVNESLPGRALFRPLILPVWLRAQAGTVSASFDVINAINLFPFPSHLSNPWFFCDQKVRKTHYLNEQSKYLLIPLSVPQMRDGQKLTINPHVLNISGTKQLIFGNTRTCLIWVCVYTQNMQVIIKTVTLERRLKHVYFYLRINSSRFPKDSGPSFHLGRHFKHFHI